MLSESAAVAAPYRQLPCLRDSAAASSAPRHTCSIRLQLAASVPPEPLCVTRRRPRRPHLIRSLIERYRCWISFRRCPLSCRDSIRILFFRRATRRPYEENRSPEPFPDPRP